MHYEALAGAIPRVARTSPDEFAHTSLSHVMAVERDLGAACRSLSVLLSQCFRHLARLTSRALVTVPVRFRFQTSALLMNVLGDSYAASITESELGARIAAVARAPIDEASLRKLSMRLTATVAHPSAPPWSQPPALLDVDVDMYEAALAALKRKRHL